MTGVFTCHPSDADVLIAALRACSNELRQSGDAMYVLHVDLSHEIEEAEEPTSERRLQPKRVPES